MTFVPGQKVKLIKSIKNNQLNFTTKPCHKCNGSKTWANPFNEEDIRACLSCKGTGEIQIQELVKDDNGKPVWNKFPVNTKGVVEKFFIAGKFNTFISPSEDNIQVFVKTDIGIYKTNINNVIEISE